MHANVCCVGISGQLQFSVFVCVVVPYTVFSLQRVSKVLASPQLYLRHRRFHFFELCRPPHHHPFPLLPLSMFCCDTLPHGLKLQPFCPHFSGRQIRPKQLRHWEEGMDGGRWGKGTKERWHGCMHSLCVYAVSLTVGGRTAERGQSGKGRRRA